MLGSFNRRTAAIRRRRRNCRAPAPASARARVSIETSHRAHRAAPYTIDAIPGYVTAGLVPAIHVLNASLPKDVDARHRRQVYAVCAKHTAMAGHDEEYGAPYSIKPFSL
jgi:hypothetical protein